MPLDPPLSAAQQRSLRRRDTILSTAIELLGQNGIDGVTCGAVTERADVSVESIDYYFGGQQNLVAEALRELRVVRHERIGRMLAALPPVGSSTADWNAAVADVARGLIWLAGDGNYTDWDLAEQAARVPALAAEAAESLDVMQESVGQLMLACGVPRGELLGRPLTSLQHGLVTHHRLRGDSEEDLVDDLSHALLALLNGHLELFGPTSRDAGSAQAAGA